MRSTVEIIIRRIKLDRGGYEVGTGAYYGVGQKVWNMRDANEALGVHRDFRANDLQSARTYARSYMDHNHASDVRFVR